MPRSCLTGLSPTWQQRWALRRRESLVELRQEAAGGGRQLLGSGGGDGRRWAARRWRGGASWFCDHAAASSVVLCRSFGMVPHLQFINSVDGVRDGVLLVLPSVVHRDKYPQCILCRVRCVAVH